MSSNDHLPSVSEWISGQTVFVTGSSGSVGKVFLYKLLKSCAGINVIYVLLRAKKGKNPSQRLNELFSSPMFDNLKKEDPVTFKKVRVIEGDVCEKYLGINESDWDLLQREVTLFFNAAASVRFDDSLQKAIFTNTRSAKYALLLAKGMKHLKAFVHVSTLYSNCHLHYIPEEIIPTGSDPEKMILTAESLDEYDLEIFSKKLLRRFPNTYIFTKNLAEALLYKHRHEVPLVIYRPGIVMPSTKEPEPGWCDSLNGMSALGGAAGKGILQVLLLSNDGVTELINADACVNGMIVSAWYRDTHLSKNKEPIGRNIIFNAKDYDFTLGYYCDWLRTLELSHPFRDSIWRGYGIRTTNHLVFKMCIILLQFIPGLIVDFMLQLSNKKPMLVRVHRKLCMACLNLEYFMTNKWNVETKNFEKLRDIVPEEEKKIFFIDSLFEVSFEKMMLNFVGGSRRLFGLPFEVEKVDVQHAYRMYYLDLALRLALVGLLIWMLPVKSYWDCGISKLNSYKDAFENVNDIISV